MADRIKNYQQEADQITTLKAIRTDLGVTPSSYTPDATVVTKDRVVTFAQAEEELVVLSDIEKGVKQQVTEVDIAQKDVANIKALLQGHLYDYQTDTNTAYTKSVPAGALPYAGLEKVGGKTIAWNQLVDTGATTVTTISGHKYYTLIDGTASIVTSSGSAITIVDDTADMVTDLTLCYGSGNEPTTVAEFQQMFPADYYAFTQGTLLSAGVTEVISKGKNLADPSVFFGAVSTATYNDGYWTDKLVNIKTEFDTNASNKSPIFYGEKITVSFDIRYNTDSSSGTLYYSIMDAKTYEVTNSSITFTDTWKHASNTFTNTYPNGCKIRFSYSSNKTVNIKNLQIEESATETDYTPYTTSTYNIPASIQALEGYGWSAGSVYNYIDYERKMFVKRVASVDLGTLEWTYFDNNTPPYFRAKINDKKDGVCGGVCSKYIVSVESGVSSLGGNNGIAFNSVGANIKHIYVVDNNYTDVTAFTSAMSGVYLYYELATPVETDISQYLTDDNLVQVEAGGTLTFENQHGDDYRLPVSSEETYMIDLQEAINNG